MGILFSYCLLLILKCIIFTIIHPGLLHTWPTPWLWEPVKNETIRQMRLFQVSHCTLSIYFSNVPEHLYVYRGISQLLKNIKVWRYQSGKQAVNRRTYKAITKRRTHKAITKRRTDKAMTKRRIGQTMIYKTIHRKLKREQYESTKNRSEIMCSGRVFTWHMSC